MEINQHSLLPTSPRPIAIIGAGGIVMEAHLPAYSLAGWQVMGIFDLDQSKAEAAVSKFPIVSKIFSDLGDLIKIAFKQQAVFDLAVPADQISRILQQLPNGSAVLIQKPMGETLAEAAEIHEISSLSQRPLPGFDTLLSWKSDYSSCKSKSASENAGFGRHAKLYHSQLR